MKRSTLALLAGVAALPLVALAALSVPKAQDGGTPLTRAEIEQIVREYLVANPDVIIESLDAWRDRQEGLALMQAEEAGRAYLPRLAAGEAGVALGAPLDRAEVVVIEFFDYHCGYCRRATDFVLDLTEREGVRVVFQDLPILREESTHAALAGLAAGEAADFPRFHKAMMTTAGVLDERAVEQAARRSGATEALELLEDERSRARLDAKLDLSVEAARAMGLEGTPTFLIATPDGAQVRVVPSYAPEMVEAAIEELSAG